LRFLWACAAGPTGAAAQTAAQVAAVANPAGADYVLGSGDRLRVNVYGEQDLSGDYTVSTQGTLAFPLIGDVKAAGRTIPEVTAEIAVRLKEGFVNEPRISAEVLNYRPFYILGEVTKPGTYPYSSDMTVMNAVATAGGFTYRANTRRVFIKHAGAGDEKAYPLNATLMVQPGDTVRIGERLF
jgi:polysaccharide export outer membrane protein